MKSVPAFNTAAGLLFIISRNILSNPIAKQQPLAGSQSYMEGYCMKSPLATYVLCLLARFGLSELRGVVLQRRH